MHRVWLPRSRDVAERVFHHISLLTFLLVLLWVPTCGLWDLYDTGEGRYVQISKELLERENWVQLTMLGQPYDQKPPLPFWLIAWSMQAMGGEVTSFAARLPAVLMGIGTVLLVYWIGFNLSRGRPRSAISAALAFATMPLFLNNVPQAELNVPFAFWITLALAAYIPGRDEVLAPPAVPPLASHLVEPSPRMPAWKVALFWFAVAGAFFTKGPLVFVIAFCVPIGECIARRSWWPLRRIWPATGGVAVFGLIAFWFYAQAQVWGFDFVKNQIVGETATRFAQGDHEEPWHFYPPRLMLATLPVMFLAPWAFAWLFRERQISRAATKLGADCTEASEWCNLRPLVLWFAVPFLVLSAANGKRMNYLLPLLPPLALLLGLWLARVTQAHHVVSDRPRAVAVGETLLRVIIGLAGALVIAAVIFVGANPEFLTSRGYVFSGWMITVATALGCTALTLCAAWPHLLRGRVEHHSDTHDAALAPLPLVQRGLVAAVLGVAALGYAIGHPMMNAKNTTRPFAEKIDAMREPEIAAVDKAARPDLHVYGHYTVRDVDGPVTSTETLRIWPDVLLVQDTEDEITSEVLTAAGYQPAWQTRVTNVNVHAYVRPD